MNKKINVGALLLGLLIATEVYAAAPVIREASFHKVFDNRDYYGTGKDMEVRHSVMSGDGKIVAFIGTDNHGNYNMFIHNFESTADPVEVTLPSYVGAFNQNAALVSNYDGSRIFFNAKETGDAYRHLFGMVNGKTGEVTILFRTTSSGGVTQVPQDIGTDAAGNYLYFNQSDNGYGKGNLLRMPAQSSAVPSVVIYAARIPHPSGGTVKFIDGFDVSDDGQTIAFFGLGWDKTNGTSNRYDKELFVKTTSGIKNLTNNTQNSKNSLVISGDASTIVYTGSPDGTWDWMVTSPTAAVESQRTIENGYGSCGDRPGITKDGTMILGKSYPDGISSCYAYLIQTDGSSRLMVEPPQISIGSTYDGLHLSDDGKRTFFKNRWYVYPDGWYNMTAGVFGDNLWPTEVPAVTGVSYPGNMYSLLEESGGNRFEVKIAVNDPQDVIAEDNRVKKYVLFPNGYQARFRGTVSIYMNTESEAANLYTAKGSRGSLWPSRVPVMTGRFSVQDDDFNVGYTDTLVQPPSGAMSAIYNFILD